MDFMELYKEACMAGVKAAKETVPTPMQVIERENLLDDSSPIIKSFLVSEGLCGVAWVNIKPGNSKFANFLKKNDLGLRDSYYGGVRITIFTHNQSYERKMIHAQAMAEVFVKHGIRAYADGRLD